MRIPQQWLEYNGKQREEGGPYLFERVGAIRFP